MEADLAHGTTGGIVSGVDREPAVVVTGVQEQMQEDVQPQLDGNIQPLAEREAQGDDIIQEVDKTEEYGAGEALAGRNVRKKFGRKFYLGEVLSFDSETHWYKVLYEDGDQEELSWSELEPLLVDPATPSSKKRTRASITRSSKKRKEATPELSSEPEEVKSDRTSDDEPAPRRISTRRGSKKKVEPPKSPPPEEDNIEQTPEEKPQSKVPEEIPVESPKPKKTPTSSKQDLGKDLIGSKTKKKFGRKMFSGEVISYDPEVKYYKVRYEDGDEEELEWKELKRTLTFSNSNPVPVSDSTIANLPKSEHFSPVPAIVPVSPVIAEETNAAKSDQPLLVPQECSHPAFEAAKLCLAQDAENLEFHAWGAVVSYDKIKFPELQAVKMFPTSNHSVLHMAASHHHLAVVTTAGQVWVWRIRHGNIHERCNHWEHIPDLNAEDIVLVDIAGPDVDRSAGAYAAEQEDQIPDPFFLVAISHQGKDYILQGSQPHEPVCTSRPTQCQYQGLKTLMQLNSLPTDGVGRIVQASVGVIEVLDEPPFIGYITDTDQVYIRCVTEDHIEGVNHVTGFSGKPLKIQCGGAYNAILMTDDAHAWTWKRSTTAACQPALASLVDRKVVDVACHGQDFVALTDDGGIHFWSSETGFPTLFATSADKLRSISLGAGVCAGISVQGKLHTLPTPTQYSGTLSTPLGRDENISDTVITGLGTRDAVKVFCTQSSLIVVSNKRPRKRKGHTTVHEEREGPGPSLAAA